MITAKPLRDRRLPPSASPDPDAGRRIGGGARVGGRRVAADDGGRRCRRRATGSDDDRAALAVAAGALAGVATQLTDGDRRRHGRLRSGGRRLQAAEGDRRRAAARKAAIQRALRAATDVPLGVMRLSAARSSTAAAVAAHGHRAAASDVGVALALLRAGLERRAPQRRDQPRRPRSVRRRGQAESERCRTDRRGWSRAAAIGQCGVESGRRGC